MKTLSPAALRRGALVTALSAVLVASGCANAAPGVVAYVGDAEITQKQVETAVAAVSKVVQEGQTVSTDAVVNAMIQGELAQQIAEDKKITITDAQRDTFLKTTNLAPLLPIPDAKPIAYDVADQQLVSQKLGAAPYLAELEKRRVKLNPRYGLLDAKQKTILDSQSGSLSQPAGAPTP